jgi:hypothetical protein
VGQFEIQPVPFGNPIALASEMHARIETSYGKMASNYGYDELGEWLEPERSDCKPRRYRPYQAKSLEQIAEEIGCNINILKAHSRTGAEILSMTTDQLELFSRSYRK